MFHCRATFFWVVFVFGTGAFDFLSIWDGIGKLEGSWFDRDDGGGMPAKSEVKHPCIKSYLNPSCSAYYSLYFASPNLELASNTTKTAFPVSQW